MIVMLKLNEIL